MATDQEIAELTRLAGELVRRLDSLVEGTGDQIVGLSQTALSNRRFIWALSASLLLDIGLTVVMALGLVQLNTLATRVDTSQQLTQTQVLCPLYQQFINADTPASRELARRNGQDIDARDNAFRVIRHSYKVLNCPK